MSAPDPDWRCAHCGVQLYKRHGTGRSRRFDARYCGPAHRQAAWRARKENR